MQQRLVDHDRSVYKVTPVGVPGEAVLDQLYADATLVLAIDKKARVTLREYGDDAMIYIGRRAPMLASGFRVSSGDHIVRAENGNSAELSHKVSEWATPRAVHLPNFGKPVLIYGAIPEANGRARDVVCGFSQDATYFDTGSFERPVPYVQIKSSVVHGRP